MPDVTFVSSRFSQIPASDAINDMLGHDLAAWLRDELRHTSFEVGEVITEDYGYGFWLILDGSHYWITSTQLEPTGFNDQPHPKWHVGVDYDPGCLFLLRLRRRPKPDHVPRIAQAIHTLLESDLAIREIAWWAEGVGNGDPTPDPPTH